MLRIETGKMVVNEWSRNTSSHDNIVSKLSEGGGGHLIELVCSVAEKKKNYIY